MNPVNVILSGNKKTFNAAFPAYICVYLADGVMVPQRNIKVKQKSYLCCSSERDKKKFSIGIMCVCAINAEFIIITNNTQYLL